MPNTTTQTPTVLQVANRTGLPAVIKANKDAGLYFFEPKTINFFSSCLDSKLYGGCFFVTSEKPRSDVRKWTVRCALDSGNIHTVGDFWTYTTLARARAAAKGFANQLSIDGKLLVNDYLYTR